MSFAVVTKSKPGVADDALAIVTESLDRREIVHVFGIVDFASAGTLETALTSAVRIGKPLIANLRECSFIDAAGIGVLVRARKALGGLFSVLIAPGSLPDRLLHLVDLGGMIGDAI